MVGRTLDWKEELGRWLKPFLDRLGHKARRQMCPLYVSGLISGTFLTSYRYRLKTCWPTPKGAHSVGAMARKESSRLVSLLSGCGSPTDHHSGSGTKAGNIYPGTKLGLSANTGCRERRKNNTTT